MSVPRFIRARFMCNFLEEKHPVKALVKRQAQFSGSAARRSRETMKTCAYFVVEELICKAHFNDIKNLPMKRDFYANTL